MSRLFVFGYAIATFCFIPNAIARHVLTVQIIDSETREPLAARLYLTSRTGTAYYFDSLDQSDGTAFRYEKQNWINKSSTEYHTTVSAHAARSELPAGEYELIVERGKEYFPHRQKVLIRGDQKLTIPLRRWINMNSMGWFSGDTHIHRELDAIRNVILAEDLNVVFPLTNWVTKSDTPPSAGDKNLAIDIPDQLIKVDETHVIWPRNTEYEIFSVGEKRHTLGALFVLGHSDALEQTVPPWKPVIAAARMADPDVLFDMDKLAWPFAMLLPTLAPDATYELANNHMWRTEFAFRRWYTPAPPFISPPFGVTEGGESDWIDFTFGMYYTLLNCGFRLPPSAGTANGVHPVPAGHGRVYVHLPDGFSYQSWREGLQRGRSFVTTGPMLLASADGNDAGKVFQLNEPQDIALKFEVFSEEPLTFGEVVINGRPDILLRPQNTRTVEGAFRSVIETTIRPIRSGWFAVRFWEDRPDGRIRFAHSAPWYTEIASQKIRPSSEEKAYLVGRMQTEIDRSRGVVSEAGLAEYKAALEYYQSLEIRNDDQVVSESARELRSDRDLWLENMIVDHRFTAQEIRNATGLSLEEATNEIQRVASVASERPKGQIRVLPYPGGRHPRRGFLEGAINPQRETKISVFPPWENGGYAVIDVPEAIFSNLGLTYLAHEHIPTIWSERSVALEKLEWQQSGPNEYGVRRKLPNGIELASRIGVEEGAVTMRIRLTNGTEKPLAGLRSQVCVMLKGLIGFNSQRRRNEIVEGPIVAVKSDLEDRWIITAWQPHKRSWTNPPVPCIHSDPVFPDCPPGESVDVAGKLWFHEGTDIQLYIDRIKQSL